MVILCVIFSYRFRRSAPSSASLRSLPRELNSFRPPILLIPRHLQMPSLQPLSFQIIANCPGVGTLVHLCLRTRHSSLTTRHFLHSLFSRACALFHFTYAVSSLFATLTKTAGVRGHSSHSGTQLLRSLGLHHLSETSVTIEFLAHSGGRALDPLQRLP
jgi:hypothetical protein